MHYLNRRVEVDKEDIKKLCEERGIIYKADFMDGLSEKQFDEGCIKLYIPADGNGGCGEGIWGLITPEDKKKYMDDNFYGEIKSVLCNNPINYFGSCFGVVKFRLFAREKTDQYFRKTTLKMCYFQS